MKVMSDVVWIFYRNFVLMICSIYSMNFLYYFHTFYVHAISISKLCLLFDKKCVIQDEEKNENYRIILKTHKNGNNIYLPL